jgi:hypothetical protein
LGGGLVPIETIADLVGHSGTNVTEHVITPVRQAGADAMDQVSPSGSPVGSPEA